MSKKVLGLYKPLEADKQIKITEELLENYNVINVALTEACLKQPIPGQQYVLRLRANDRRKRQENNATLVVPGSKVFSPAAEFILRYSIID